MLLSLIKPVTIFVHPEYLSAVRHVGLFKKQIRHKEVIAIKSLDESSVSDKVIIALKKLLNKPEWKNSHAKIVLSGDFTKFRVIAWNSQLTQQEQKVRAQSELEDLYDTRGGSLHVFISSSGYRNNSLAFAIDEHLYTGLLVLEKTGFIRLNAIIPFFVHMTNYWRQSIHSSAWLIIKENTYIYHAKLINNSWSLIKVDTVKEGWEQESQKVLSRDAMQSEEASVIQNVYFYEDSPSRSHVDTIKRFHPNIIVLERNTFKNINPKLSFASYSA